MEADDREFVRELLNAWARWLCCGGGYAHQSSIEWAKQGGMSSGVFGSSIPKDVEPSLRVAMVSRAMQHLRQLDGPAAELLAEIYLRKEKARLVDLAVRSGVGLTVYQERRRSAETKLFSLFLALGGGGRSDAP
jgi:hypothetical protein